MKKLFIDIETLPDQTDGVIDEIIKEIRPPANYKKPESIQKWMEENAEPQAIEQWKKTALKGIAGEICSIAWAFDNEDIEVQTSTSTHGEYEIVENFFAAVRQQASPGEGAYPNIMWIGHNVIDFDLRFLFQRAVILGVNPGIKLPINDRHGRHVFDTMKEWAGWKDRAKLDDIFFALQIDLGENWDDVIEVDGSQVWDLWQAGLYDKIARYNCYDVEKTRAVYKRMTWTT